MPGFMDALNPAGAAPQTNFQQASSFQQTLTPQQGVPQMGPPSTPQELEQRRSGWQEFIHKIQNDPAVRTAAFMTAGQLMRGPDMGESMAGGIGRSIQLGTLAHSFMSNNQQRQMLEQQKLDEQRRVNEANIAQSQAQTQGLLQNQQHTAEDRPLDRRGKELKNEAAQFDMDAAPGRLEQEHETANSKRTVDAAQVHHYRNKGNTAGASTQMTHEREDRLMRTANPRMAGETPEAYEQRLAQLTISRGVKSQDAVSVQAAQAILRDGEPGTPEYDQALQVMSTVSAKALASKQPGGAAQPAQQFTKTDFEVAALKAKSAGKSTFVGPDGVTYKVPK